MESLKKQHITPLRQTLLYVAYTVILLSEPTLAQADDPDHWDTCRALVEAIRNGSTTHDGITKDNIGKLLYDGPVRGLVSSYPRNQLLLVTYEGCNRLCGKSTVVWNTPQTALNIAATWVFPLAILLGLPFESYHRKKVRKTLAAVSNWLGSPQTALTAAIWNFRQTRDCHRRVRDAGMVRVWADSYYVLSCFNQFELRLDSRPVAVEHLDGEVVREEPLPDQLVLLQTLVYGLFRPLSRVSVGRIDLPRNGNPAISGAIELQDLRAGAHRQPPQANGNAVPRLSQEQQRSLTIIEEQEIQLTTELLSALAFQLRMHRRRGVIPTLASLGTFLMAFIFSLVLAFGDLSDSTTIFVLDLGIFFSWLPVLVIFTIVDRNPVSSERQATLMSRFLYNANAIRKWSDTATTAISTRPIPQPPPTLTLKAAVNQITWWTPSLTDLDLAPLQVGPFIGQGRRLQYCGLTCAILKSTQTRGSFNNWTRDTPARYAEETSARLGSSRPLSWYVTATVCLLIVWIEVMLAFAADFITPTVGLGCWSLVFLLYGCFSSITWFLQLWRTPAGRRGRTQKVVLGWVSHSFNALSVLWIVLIVILLASGVLNNCYCNACMPGFAGYGGYTDFETFQFYRDNYGLTQPWIAAAAIGSSIPIAALIVALSWWQKCKHLWAASESGAEHPERRPEAISMIWLGE